MLHRLVENLVY